MSSGRNQLKGQTAIVTGAGRGIGRGIATTLAACGMNVALVARTEEQLRSVQSEIQSAGGTAEVFPTDITSDSEISSLLTGVVEHGDAGFFTGAVAAASRSREHRRPPADDSASARPSHS